VKGAVPQGAGAGAAEGRRGELMGGPSIGGEPMGGPPMGGPALPEGGAA